MGVGPSAAAGSSSDGGRCESMLKLARQYDREQRMGVWEETHCAQPIGSRPAWHNASEVGTTCEPWVHRGAVFVLSRLLDLSTHGLEWSVGSSTRFYLSRLASLHSIEHDALWARNVSETIRSGLPNRLTRHCCVRVLLQARAELPDMAAKQHGAAAVARCSPSARARGPAQSRVLPRV